MPKWKGHAQDGQERHGKPACFFLIFTYCDYAHQFITCEHTFCAYLYELVLYYLCVSLSHTGLS